VSPVTKNPAKDRVLRPPRKGVSQKLASAPVAHCRGRGIRQPERTYLANRWSDISFP
jgi:hypothetical protein